MGELAERIAALARELFGYRGAVVTRKSDDADYLVDNPARRRPLIDKARDELGYDPTVTLDEGLERIARLVRREPRRRGRVVRVVDRRRRLCRPRHRRVPGGVGARGRASPTSIPTKVDAINARRRARSTRPVSPSCSTRNAGERLRATTDVGEAVRGSELTLVAVGTPSTSAGIDLSGDRRRHARRSARRSPARANYHAVVVKSTVVPGTTDGIVTSTLEDASGRRAGDGSRAWA